jgi:hypothetical protein
MLNDYDSWNRKKKIIEAKKYYKYIKEREIWWCSAGLNIGDEQNGKNFNFERPFIIIKKFNRKFIKLNMIHENQILKLNPNVITT